MGTMGSWAWTARWKAPFLNGRREGVGEAERVPSGKMKSDNYETNEVTRISENQSTSKKREGEGIRISPSWFVLLLRRLRRHLSALID